MSPLFLRRIASHNRHALAAAGMSLAGALLLWSLAYALLAGVALGVLTVAQGQAVVMGEEVMSLPSWLQPSALGVALATLVWAAVDEHRTRYHPCGDRPLIGWHLLGDVVLLPARLTFGIGHQLAAIIRLSHEEKLAAFDLLRHLHEQRRCPATSLGAIFPDARQLRRLLVALQLVGWIDLLRTEDGWIYIERSIVADELREMFEE